MKLHPDEHDSNTVSKYRVPTLIFVGFVVFFSFFFTVGLIDYNNPSNRIFKNIPVDDLETQDYSSEQPNLSVLQRQFSEQVSDRQEIELLYTSKRGGTQYFRSFIPNSSGCCAIYKYLSDTELFYHTGLFIDMVVGEKSSPTGRYVANIEYDNLLRVHDIETQSLIETVTILSKETLIAYTCGYAGKSYDIQWLDDTTLQYGVYKIPDSYHNCPEMELIEHRTLQLI